MKRKGGDGGRRATVFDKKDAGRRTSEGMEMEDLCSKLTSLVPQEYRLDTASQVYKFSFRSGIGSSKVLYKFEVNYPKLEKKCDMYMKCVVATCYSASLG
jgi:hypothetical protein